MTLLANKEIETLLRASPSLIDGFDTRLLNSPASPVRGASLYLSVGDIFLPGTGIEDLGSATKPLRSILLERGQTAVLRTVEHLHVPASIAGIGFPPSKDISLAGLLTTNPGHIDPNYRGPLHLTVINMGKRAFNIERGQRIMKLLLFRLSVDAGTSPPTVAAIDDELLDRLSKDFLDIDHRGAEAAKKAVDEADLRFKSRQVWIPALGAFATILAGGVALFLNIYWGNAELKSQIAKLQSQVSAQEDIKKIEDRLKVLEQAVPKPSAPK